MTNAKPKFAEWKDPRAHVCHALDVLVLLYGTQVAVTRRTGVPTRFVAESYRGVSPMPERYLSVLRAAAIKQVRTFEQLYNAFARMGATERDFETLELSRRRIVVARETLDLMRSEMTLPPAPSGGDIYARKAKIDKGHP
jgi:hypothetical protein